ncbi:MAG: ATP-binding protein [Thermodesulfovibrionia bacterium]
MIKKELIKEIIREFHTSELPSSKKRNITIPLNTGKVISITGVRRSGKTYMLFETIKGLLSSGIPKKRILYINFEDERFDLRLQELDLILQSYRELYPDIRLSECYLFFDEVQNIQGWERFIRRLHDKVTRNIFITGSSSRLLSREIATTLRGRTLTYEIFPLSFAEFLRFHDIEIDIYNPVTKARIINLFEQFLLYGGFPEIIGLADIQLRNKILQEYLDVMLYRDLIERFNISNISVLRYFLKRVFENITSPLSVNKIYNELRSQGYKLGKNTLYEFLDAAEAIYLFLIIKKYHGSVLKQELGEKKAYAIDNGLLNAITYKFSKDLGKLLENTIFLELCKRGDGENTYFYKNKKEVDFIIIERERVNEIIQVSYSISDRITLKREIEGLMTACKTFGIKEARLITYSEEDELVEGGIKINIIPAYKWILT